MSIFISIDNKFFLPFHFWFWLWFFQNFLLFGWLFWGGCSSFLGISESSNTQGFKDCQILRISKSSIDTNITFKDIEILKIWRSLNPEDLRILRSSKIEKCGINHKKAPNVSVKSLIFVALESTHFWMGSKA